jgi:ABC-2 type transport system ATP-binding protein
VDENIEFFAEINLVYQYEERREELLRLTRLLPFRDRLAERLSGGMKQKLALACTLIHTPRLLFLDEPTTGVDPVSRRDFWRILHTLQSQGLSIVMTTPYLDEAERCGRMGMLNEGRLMVTGTPSEVRALMKHEILEVVCHPVRNARQILLGHPRIKEIHMFGDRLNILVADAANDGRVIETYLKSHGLAVTSWRKIPPSIENVFISLVGLRETEEAHL